jgi:hypothetical protein
VETDWFMLVGGLVALIVGVAALVVVLVTPDVLLMMFEQAQAGFFLIIGGVGALLHWIGSFFPSFEQTTETLPRGASGGGLPASTPVVPTTTVAVPPSWAFELMLTFVGVVFLIFAVRAVYRLMKMNMRSFDLRMSRQRDPSPAISSSDAFTWSGWWQLVLAWLRGWLAGPKSTEGRSGRAQRQAGEVVAEQRSIRALYREMLTVLARAGFERQPSTTPNELASEVNAARPTASRAISTVTDLYVRTRYGEEQVGRDELSRMRSAVQQARKDLSAEASRAEGSAGRPTGR